MTMQRSSPAEPRDVAPAPPFVGSVSVGGEKDRAASNAEGEAGKGANGEHRGANVSGLSHLRIICWRSLI